jgi:hypothetical protein
MLFLIMAFTPRPNDLEEGVCFDNGSIWLQPRRPSGRREMAVSDDCCTTSVYYEPPPVYPDSAWDIPWLLIVPLIIFIAALILLYFLSSPDREKPKTLRQKMNEAIDELIESANLFDRKEAANALRQARADINDIIDKERIL